jgi:hypothetical protein
MPPSQVVMQDRRLRGFRASILGRHHPQKVRFFGGSPRVMHSIQLHECGIWTMDAASMEKKFPQFNLPRANKSITSTHERVCETAFSDFNLNSAFLVLTQLLALSFFFPF